MDSLDGTLELVRRRDDGDLLGVRDGGEDDRLRVVWEIDGWSSDWAVVWGR